jgi:arylsulfatase A-like enzyme
VLLTIDALRPDHLGLYGYARDTSPVLDQLAKAGVVFDRATAQAARTWQSVMSLLSGRYPTRAGVRVLGAALPPEVPLLPDLLGAAGYETVAGSGLAGFPSALLARFDDERQAIKSSADRWLSAQTVRQIREVAKEIALRPTFAWFHLENAHYPLEPTEPLRYDPGYTGRFQQTFSIEDRASIGRSEQLTAREITHLRALYDASIRDADALVLELISALVANGVSEDTILIISADHGELVGEHGIALEHQTPFEGVLHVPLLIVWPKQLSPRRIAQRVQLVDLVPTLFSLAGLPRPEGLDGRDLSPLLRGGTLPDAPAYAEVGESCRVQYRGDEKLLTSAPHTVLHLLGANVPLPEEALYDLARDPDEAHPLALPRGSAARALLDAEAAREEADQPREGGPQIGQAALETLRGAGYLAAPAPR